MSDAIKKYRNIILSNIYKTEHHDKIKKCKHEKHAEIFGTPKYTKVKDCKRIKYNKLLTHEHDQIKKMKHEKYTNIRGTPRHEEIKTKSKIHVQNKISSKTSGARISKFTELIREGPYYICVACNRCLYHRSVLLFKVISI